MSQKKQGISGFQKYLTLWVAICMGLGIFIGRFIPQIPDFLERFKYSNVSIPIAILIWVMIFPMMMKVDFQNELPSVDIVITIGCNVKCPFIPCKYHENWNSDDPTAKSDDDFIQTIKSIYLKIISLKDLIVENKGRFLITDTKL